MSVEAEGTSGTEAYAALIERELDAQEARKASLEQRGLAVITTAGALTSLLFGLAAFSTTGAHAFVLPASARHLLINPIKASESCSSHRGWILCVGVVGRG